VSEPRQHSGLCLRVLAAAVFYACYLSADQIVMKDDDRITGTVIKKDGEKLTIASKNFGEVTMKWEDVESIRTDAPVTVVLGGDRTEKVEIDTQDGKIRIGRSEPPQMVEPKEIIALRNEEQQSAYEKFLRPGILDLWVVNGSISLSGARGNANTSTLTTPVNMVRTSNTSRTALYFTAIRSTALVDGVSRQTAQAIRGGWAFNRNISKRMFINTFNDWEYGKLQSLDLRTVVGGGAGYRLWKGETGQWGLVAGVGWNREAFTPKKSKNFIRHAGEPYSSDDLNFKFNSRTSLVQCFRMSNNVSGTGQYRINLDIGVATALTKWLTWNVSRGDRALGDPVPGQRRNDLLYSTGLGFTLKR